MDEEPKDLSYTILRRTVGLIGFALPFMLVFFALIFDIMPPSMSHFYYTGMQDVFVVSVSLVGVFLMSYGGYDKEDDERLSDHQLGILTGICGIGLALFATSKTCNDWGHSCLSTHEYYFGWVHLGFAGLFLLGLGVFSYSKFSRTNGPHWLTYRMLGLGIFLCLFVITAVKLLVILKVMDDPQNSWLFWAEAIAVLCFATAWLLKGETWKGIKNVYRRMFFNGSKGA